MREVDTRLGSVETTAVQRYGQQFFLEWPESSASPRIGTQACEGVGLVELESKVLRGLGKYELASYPETGSVLRITQGRGGEGKAPQRQKTVEE